MARVKVAQVYAAIATIGLVFVTSMPASTQTVRYKSTHAELRKKAPKPKPAFVRAPVKKSAPPAEQSQTTEPFAQPASIPVPPPRPPQAPAVQAVGPEPAPQGPPLPAQVDQPAQTAPRLGPPRGIRVSATQLNMVRTAPEMIGQVPNHFFWIRQGLQAVQDPVDGQLVFIADDGRIAGRAKLPPAFIISEVFPEENQIRLIDGGRRQLVLLRNLDPAALPALTETTVAADGVLSRNRLTRRSAQQLTLNDERRAGARPLEVRSLAGGQLAQAYEVGPGSGDYRYVVSEEIVAAKPTLQVRMFVQRFDRAGKLTGAAYVPLDDLDAVPRDFVTVTDAGVVRVLVPRTDGIKIREIAFAGPPAGKSLNAEELKSLGRALREIAVDANLTGGSHLPFRGDAPNVEITPPTPPIKRDIVLANARAYLAVNWVLQPDNFSRPDIENECDPQRGKLWLRPRHFTPALIGTTIGPMPYRWGGEDTPQSFLIRVEWGALAGDMCTCRDAALNYCVFGDSAGVDCSGFVSRAWGIDKRGTSGLLDVASDVDSLADLKPGDAFDWPQRHVRLFIGPAPGAATAFNVLEASTRLECEGVCERTLRPSEVNGYRLIRYRGVSEEGATVAEPVGPPAPPNGAPAETAGTTPEPNTVKPVPANGATPPAKKRGKQARRR